MVYLPSLVIQEGVDKPLKNEKHSGLLKEKCHAVLEEGVKSSN